MKKKEGRKRPGQLIALLIIMVATILSSLYMWSFYANVVGGNSLPVSMEELSTYRRVLLVTVSLYLIVWILLFFGTKIGFWTASALYAMDLFSKLMSLNLLGSFLTGLCLYFLLCRQTRLYFGIEGFKSSGLRKK